MKTNPAPRRCLAGEEGATAVEYAILLAGIALVIISAIAAMGGSANMLFEGNNAAIEAARSSVSS